MKAWFAACIIAFIALWSVSAVGQRTLPETMFTNKPPRLVVLISIDQFRADYLTRFRDLFLPAKLNKKDPGGFRFLMETGAWFLNANYKHVPTYTGPGHAIISTGSAPYLNGIVGNGWYDRQAKRSFYCVEDSTYKVVGSTSTGGSSAPTRLMVTTIGDELKMATGDRAKVVGVALKDRAAILLAGHNADAVVWFEERTGNWVTSTYYAKDGKLFSWAEEINASNPRVVDSYYGKVWDRDPRIPADAWGRTLNAAEYTGMGDAFGKSFPHKIHGKGPGDPSTYNAFTNTPFANEFVLNTAARAIVAERLGVDAVPDLLCINLSTNDYIGHAFGPNSPEVMDVTVQTDRALSGFLKFVNDTVPGGLDEVVVVISADHGVAPIPEEAVAKRQPVNRLPESTITAAVETALDEKYGAQDWVVNLSEPHLYLNREAVSAQNALVDATPDGEVRKPKAEWKSILEEAADTIRLLPGIGGVYTSTQIMNGNLPQTEIAQPVYRGYMPSRSGDLVVIGAPGWLFGGSKGTTHGSPYPYDTNVALIIRGTGVSPGVFAEPVGPQDIAPTLAVILGVVKPNGCVGEPLTSALKSK